MLVSVTYITEPSSDHSMPFVTPKPPRSTRTDPSGATEYSAPAGSRSVRSMLPTRNRPNGSHLPSLKRMSGVACRTRASSRSTVPRASVSTTVSPRAATNPPVARGWKLARGGGSATLDSTVPSARAVVSRPSVMSVQRSRSCSGSQTMLSTRTACSSQKTVTGPVAASVCMLRPYRRTPAHASNMFSAATPAGRRGVGQRRAYFARKKL